MKGWTVLKEDSTVTGSLYEKHNYWVMVLYGLSAALYPEKNITDLSQKKKTLDIHVFAVNGEKQKNR